MNKLMLVLTALGAVAAQAHEGHGLPGAGHTHADSAWPLLAVVAVLGAAAAAAAWWQRQR